MLDLTSQTKLFQIFIIKCLFVKKKYRSTLNIFFYFQVSLCISIETVEVLFFVTGLETLQVLGVEMSTDASTKF
jgi:hypothetical protein